MRPSKDEFLESIFNRLENHDSYYRRQAISALLCFIDPRAKEKLISILLDDDESLEIRFWILSKMKKNVGKATHEDKVYTEFIEQIENKMRKMSRTRDIVHQQYGDIVIADLGTYCSRIGFIGESEPKVQVRSLLCGPKSQYLLGHSDVELDKSFSLVGGGDLTRVLYLSKYSDYYNFTSRNHLSFFELEIFLKKISTMMKIDLSEKSIIFAYHPLNIIVKELSIKKIKGLFQNLFMIPVPILILNAINKNTGLVVDSGEEYTSIYPIYQGKIINEAIIQTKVGGKLVEEYLSILLNGKGYSIKPNKLINEMVREIKETFCYVGHGNDTYHNEEEVYITMDGDVTRINDEKHLATEILFNPALIQDNQEVSIQRAIIESINECPNAIKEYMFNNIIISGGNTLFDGFAERLELELLNLLPNGTTYNIISHENRDFLVWKGGSYIAKMDIDIIKSYSILNQKTHER